MRVPLFLIALAAAGSVHAADSINVGHRVIPDAGEAEATPMAWRYHLLQTAQDVFDEHVATQAPGAALAFQLPKVDAAQGENQVEIVQGDKHLPLPMLSATTFALPRHAQAPARDAMVVANRRFPKGEMNHPVVQVRSPGLPDGVKRMGDLRLACAAQMAMAKAEDVKFRALFATAGLFGLDICDKLEVTNIDGPAGSYDTVTIEDGGRRLVLSAKQPGPPRLGDHGWSDNARISYTLNDHIVR